MAGTERTDLIAKMPPKDPGTIQPLDGAIDDGNIEAAIKDWKKRSPLENYPELLEAEQVEES